MEEDFVAHEEYSREHVLDDRIATHTSLVQSVKQLASAQTMLLDVRIQLCKRWEHLLIKRQSQL